MESTLCSIEALVNIFEGILLRMKLYDCIVIGGGPAGVTAAIYLKNAEKNILLISESAIGGKVLETFEIKNIPGFISISGEEFGSKLENQLIELGIQVEYSKVTHVDFSNNIFSVICREDKFESKSVVLALGTNPRLLGVPVLVEEGNSTPECRRQEDCTERNFIGDFIHTCALCDGVFYKDKTVAVVGGGNSAITEAIYLSSICKKVVLVQNLKILTADKSLISILNSKGNIEIYLDQKIESFNKHIDGEIEIKVKNNESKFVDGIFISIGSVPNTDILKGKQWVCIDNNGYIMVTDKMESTCAVDGVFAAGDCTNTPIKQITTACAQGTIAAKSAIEYLYKK